MTKEELQDEAAAWRLVAKRLAGRTKFKFGFCYYFMFGGALVAGMTRTLLDQMEERLIGHMALLENDNAAHFDENGGAYIAEPGKRKIRTLAALLLAEECDDEAEAAGEEEFLDSEDLL